MENIILQLEYSKRLNKIIKSIDNKGNKIETIIRKDGIILETTIDKNGNKIIKIKDTEGNIAGVAIAPGIRTAFNSLFANAAQIPAIPLDIPPTSLGKNTFS